MDIHSFLEKTAGDWFSQRTIYTLKDNQVNNSKANLTIKSVPPNDDSITQLSEKYHLHQPLTLGGIVTKWDNSPDWGKTPEKGHNLLILSTEENINSCQQGQIFQPLNNDKILMGKYLLAEDESLTFIIKENAQEIEERIWFASDNLRFRTVVVKQDNVVIKTSFYSEIRRMS